MTPNQLRQKYLDFFSDKIRQHAIIPSAPLLPENDPTTLFTSAGMQPLIPYLLGQEHPQGKRLVDSQKCFRAVDIEEVGDNRHTTFFEMLGNWSLGSYSKKDQLTWLWEFLTEVLKLPQEKLQVTVFAGNDMVPKDKEAIAIWTELALPENHIHEYSAQKNWWSRSGTPEQMPVGEPGGPSSEIFYDYGPSTASTKGGQAGQARHDTNIFGSHCHPNCDCGRFMEIGNSVFMSYQKTASGIEELKQKNIDFGGGLERILAAMQDEQDVFKTDLFVPIIKKIEQLSNKRYDTNVIPHFVAGSWDQHKRSRHESGMTKQSFRIIADHVKAATMLAADGVFPSNKQQGYFSRRLLRRAIRHGKKLGIEQEFLSDLVDIVAEIYSEAYPEIQSASRRTKIKNALEQEEKKFRKTLEKGLREFEKEIKKPEGKNQKLSAELAFRLYESYGFPLELSLEEAQSRGIEIEDIFKIKFLNEKKKHAEASRTASAGMFKGGLADQSEITTKYHTATHLLHAALRKILGKHVEQKGSNITAERLRFDFTHPQALTQKEKQEVEDQINAWIAADLPVTKKTMNKQEALKQGALAFFAEKYPDEVSVYIIGDKNNLISMELCGGPHVNSTGEIGKIKIVKEKSASSGVRRVYVRIDN